jgi:hypothetical protein
MARYRDDKMTVAFTSDGETWTELNGVVSQMSLSQHLDGLVTADLSVIADNPTQVFDKARLMEMRDPLYRCPWCGTWKARKCSCPKCGAPDDL